MHSNSQSSDQRPVCLVWEKEMNWLGSPRKLEKLKGLLEIIYSVQQRSLSLSVTHAGPFGLPHPLCSSHVVLALPAAQDTLWDPSAGLTQHQLKPSWEHQLSYPEGEKGWTGLALAEHRISGHWPYVLGLTKTSLEFFHGGTLET